MRRINTRGVRLTAVVAGALFVLSACGSGTVEGETKANESKAAEGGDCGEFNIVINDWAGYYANAYVLGAVAEEELGCSVNYVTVKEGTPAYEAVASGEADLVAEDWGHPDELKPLVEAGKLVEVGTTGNVGIIGWYVPGWLAEEHPEVLDYNSLNDLAANFETSESDGKGQFLGSDPTYLQYDEAIVKNLGLDFKVIFSGGETATIEAYKKAQENKEWLIGYFWEPQYIHAEVPLVRVALPPYEDGCDKDPGKVDCDYAETPLMKISSTEFMESGSPAAALVKNFTWENDDQNLVAKYITADGMSNADAAAKWVEENPDKVDAWLQ